MKIIKNNIKLFMGLVIGLIIPLSIVTADVITAGDIPFSTTDSTTIKKKIEDINTKATNLLTIYKDEICPGCVYRKSTTKKYNSNSSGADGTNNKLTSDEYTTDYTTLNSNYFLGHVIDSNGYILSSYACGINNGTFFCLRGVDSGQSSLTYKPFYQEAVNRMKKAFPGCNATAYGSDADCYDGVYAVAYSSGRVDVYGDDGYCIISTVGSFYCSEW